MRRKQPGESASLYVDTLATIEEGDFIETTTGRRYLVTHVRVQEKGKFVGRQHLKTVVMEPDFLPPEDATIHVIWWYRR